MAFWETKDLNNTDTAFTTVKLTTESSRQKLHAKFTCFKHLFIQLLNLVLASNTSWTIPNLNSWGWNCVVYIDRCLYIEVVYKYRLNCILQETHGQSLISVMFIFERLHWNWKISYQYNQFMPRNMIYCNLMDYPFF